MKEKLRRFFGVVPAPFRSEFIDEINREGIDRLTILSLVMVLAELLLAVLEKRPDIRMIMISFLIGNAVLIPLIWVVKKHGAGKTRLLARTACLAYPFITIVFCCAMALTVLEQVDLIHVYFMALLGVAAFILMTALESAVIFGVIYIAFALIVPLIRQEIQIVYYIQVNALIFNILAWLLGRMVYRTKIDTFLQQKAMDEKNRQLQDLVRKDSMTGLLNHDASMAALRDEIDRAKRIGYPLTLVLADIDDFKQINDQYGHIAGDRVIRNLSDAVARTARRTDITGRYGGDEFIFILPGTDQKAARIFTRRLSVALREPEMDSDIRVTLSGGISQYLGESIDDFVRATDDKLYQAKNNGKNQYVI